MMAPDPHGPGLGDAPPSVKMTRSVGVKQLSARLVYWS